MDNERFLREFKENRSSAGQFSDLNLRSLSCEELILTDCRLVNGDFSHSRLGGLHLINGKVINCDFSLASLQDSVFYDKDKQSACYFKSADLRRREFHGGDLPMSYFSHAELFQTVIDNCQTQGAHFELASFTNVVNRKVMLNFWQ